MALEYDIVVDLALKSLAEDTGYSRRRNADSRIVG
jgi:hypothetical protein